MEVPTRSRMHLRQNSCFELGLEPKERFEYHISDRRNGTSLILSGTKHGIEMGMRQIPRILAGGSSGTLMVSLRKEHNG
jgi:hypothetical protein